MIVTIDGPSGTGKSTVAKKVAQKLGFVFFDTGAMYRSVAWLLMQENIVLDDQKSIETMLAQFCFDIVEKEGSKRYFVNGVDVTELIRSREVTAIVSAVAALPVVRKALWAIQHRFGDQNNAVFEGRDLGSVVFPDAECKFFLTARPEIRALRRFRELSAQYKGSPPFTVEKILLEIEERDYLDSSRPLAPLSKPKGAWEIDTSEMEIDQVVELIVQHIIPFIKNNVDFDKWY